MCILLYTSSIVCGTYGKWEAFIQILLGKPEGDRPYKDIGVSERKILKLILKK